MRHSFCKFMACWFFGFAGERPGRLRGVDSVDPGQPRGRATRCWPTGANALPDETPHVFLDVRYERVREAGRLDERAAAAWAMAFLPQCTFCVTKDGDDRPSC